MARATKVATTRRAGGGQATLVSPSTVGRYFFHDCERFLAFKAVRPKADTRDTPKAGRKDFVVQAFSTEGEAWEEKIVASMDDAVIATGGKSVAKSVHNAAETVAALHALKDGQCLFQPTLEPVPGALSLPEGVGFNTCRPDLIRACGTGAARVLEVIDIKRSPVTRFVHKAQIYLYAHLLAELVAREGIEGRVDLERGWVWHEPERDGASDDGLGGPKSFAFSEIEPFMGPFLHDTLPRVLAADPHKVPWHLRAVCRWRDFHEHCTAQAEETRDPSLIAGLTAAEKAFLRAKGLTDLPAIASRLAGADAALLRGSASLAGRAHELAARARALEEDRRIPLTTASPTMPRFQDVAVLIALVPDPVGRGVALAGYHLAMKKETATELCKTPPSPRPFRDMGEFVRALHHDLALIGAHNAALVTLGEEEGRNTWSERLSVMPYVYSNRERQTLMASLFHLLGEGTTRNGLDARAEALEVLLLLQGAELADLEEPGDQPADALPVVALASEASRLFALPAPVAPTFPEVVRALTADSNHPFDYETHGLFDGEFELPLSAAALYRDGDPDAKREEGLVWLESRMGQRLWAMQSLVWRLQDLAGRDARLPLYTPKFAWRPESGLNDPRLAQLTFLTRYESVLACEKNRGLRFQAVERMREGSATRVEARGGSLLLRDPAAGFRVDEGDRFLLVRDDEEGHRDSRRLADYRHSVKRRTRNGGLWSPEPEETDGLRLVEVSEVSPPPPAIPHQLSSTGNAPLGGEHMLFPWSVDWNVTRVIEALGGMDARPQSAVHTFLADPAAFGSLLKLPAAVRQHADKHAAKPFRRARRSIYNTVRNRRMTALIGPPGTGKTFTLGQLVRTLTRAHRDANKPFIVFVTAFTKVAIRELHESILRKTTRGVDVHLLTGRDGESDGNVIDRAIADAGNAPVVICATTFQLLKRGARDARFDLVVIDEASQMRLPEASIAVDRLAPKGRLVLCGDGEQLGPIMHGVYPEPSATGEVDADGTERPSFNPAVSVFAQALGAFRAKDVRDADGALTARHPSLTALEEGWRMNATLTSLPAALIYGPELGVDFRPADGGIAGRHLDLAPRRGRKRTDALSALAREAVDPDVPLSVIVVEDGFAPSRESAAEAAITAAIARELKDRLRVDGEVVCTADAPPKGEGGRAGKNLFVVAPHHVQIAAVRRAMADDFDPLPLVDTVEKMQGQTCEAVIVTYGVGDAELAMAEDEFIFDRNRLNVALSRARSKAVLVLSRPLLEPTPQILERESTAKGFAYLRAIVDAAGAGERHAIEVDGRPVGVTLSGITSPIARNR